MVKRSDENRKKVMKFGNLSAASRRFEIPNEPIGGLRSKAVRGSSSAGRKSTDGSVERNGDGTTWTARQEQPEKKLTKPWTAADGQNVLRRKSHGYKHMYRTLNRTDP